MDLTPCELIEFTVVGFGRWGRANRPAPALGLRLVDRREHTRLAQRAQIVCSLPQPARHERSRWCLARPSGR
jgi:hypothetical protein